MKKAWWKEAVVYQIYPRSFMDSNNDGIGDIKGITSKLDYLKTLGVTVIWLSPVYRSPNADNGYDISDYQDIMEEFGTMEDLDELLQEAHERGLKIIMDLVVNHTSDEHSWFLESRSSTDSALRDYYIWREPKNGEAPNNWGSCFGGPAWELDEKSGMYYLHLFDKKQPDLNWENEEVRDAVYNMMNWWCEKGIDGFRMDVISMISKAPGLPDGENHGGLYGDFGPHVLHGPRVHEYLREMNERVLSKYDIMTVGETPGVTVEEAKNYAGEDQKELNMVFQFEHVEGDGKLGKWTDEKMPLRRLKEVLSKWQTGLSGQAWNSLFWDNHDQPRAVSRFGDDRPRYREISAKMLATCLHMMQGTPYIYQGEELGMTNFPFTELSQFRDVESIHAYEELVGNQKATKEEMMKYLCFKSRDNARTPMQWDDSPNAGFSKAMPWIGVNPNYKEINAKKELADEGSVFHYYQKLISLRKEMELIVYGSYELKMEESEEIFSFERVYEDQKLMVYCNFTDKEVEAELPKAYEQAGYLICNYGDCDFIKSKKLRPYEAVVLY